MRDVENDTLVISLHKPFVLLEEENQLLNEREYKELIENKNQTVKAVSFNRYLQLMEQYGKEKKEKILIKDKEEIVIIPIDDISQIVVPYRKDNALAGFLLGLGIDVIVIYLYSQTLDSPTQMKIQMGSIL